MKKNISIVIPFHNECKNLRVLIPDLIKHINSIDNFFEILLVNDFSDDGSLEYCQSLVKKKNNYEIKIINLLKKSGQTGAFKKAFEVSEGDFIIRMDADLQDKPEHLYLFINKIYDGYDLIIGHRTNRKHNKFLILASNFYDRIIKIIFNLSLNTYIGSFIAFRAKFVKNLPWYNNDHRYLPIIAIIRGAKKLCTVNTPHTKRLYGKTHYNTFAKLLKGVPELILLILRIYFKKYK